MPRRPAKKPLPGSPQALKAFQREIEENSLRAIEKKRGVSSQEAIESSLRQITSQGRVNIVQALQKEMQRTKDPFTATINILQASEEKVIFTYAPSRDMTRVIQGLTRKATRQKLKWKTRKELLNVLNVPPETVFEIEYYHFMQKHKLVGKRKTRMTQEMINGALVEAIKATAQILRDRKNN